MPTFFFAYGQFLSSQTLQRVCANARVVRSAYLPGHRLMFRELANEAMQVVAGLAQADTMRVWGVVYALPPRDMIALDIKMANGVHRIRRQATVHTPSGPDTVVYLYRVAHPDAVEVPPDEHYIYNMTAGAAEHDLPADYTHFLNNLWAESVTADFRQGLLLDPTDAPTGVGMNARDLHAYTRGGRTAVRYGGAALRASAHVNPTLPRGVCRLSPLLKQSLEVVGESYGVHLSFSPATATVRLE